LCSNAIKQHIRESLPKGSSTNQTGRFCKAEEQREEMGTDEPQEGATVKKANKAAAQDWNNEQRILRDFEEQFEEQENLLRYAAEKRKCNYPCAEMFHNAGYIEVAAKIKQAYSLLQDAYYLLENTKREML
jgi:hypothetical protein